MDNQVLKELKVIRELLANLLGTTELPKGEQFSVEAVKKAAKEFKVIQKARGEWVDEHDIDKYLKGGGWQTGKFIRMEFGFNAFIKSGYRYSYKKKALLQLVAELKKRNVNLKRYME